MKRMIFAALLLAGPAFATPQDIPDGKGGWKPNPDCTGSCATWNDPPKRTPSDKGSDSDQGPLKEQHWTGVCRFMLDGNIEAHTAFGRDQATAHRQCREKLEGK